MKKYYQQLYEKHTKNKIYKLQIEEKTLLRIQIVNKKTAIIYFTDIVTGEKQNIPEGFELYNKDTETKYVPCIGAQIYAIELKNRIGLSYYANEYADFALLFEENTTNKKTRFFEINTYEKVSIGWTIEDTFETI
jgi:hypothetical protein